VLAVRKETDPAHPGHSQRRGQGNAPKQHDQAIQQFALLVRDLGDALRSAGKAFNDAKAGRALPATMTRRSSRHPRKRDVIRAAVDFLTVRGACYGFHLFSA
jgi:hypothetical protein